MAEPDDLRQFFRDIAARHERIWREQAEMLRAMREESREAVAMLRALREETSADHRAQLQALLHVLDGLENGGAPA